MIGELLIAGALYEHFFKDGSIKSEPKLKEVLREVYKIVDDDELNRRVKDLEYEAKEVNRRHAREDKQFKKNGLTQLY